MCERETLYRLLQAALRKHIFVHSRVCGAVAPVVHDRRDTHNNGGKEIARDIIIFLPRIFAFKDLHQHQIELNSLQTHPCKRGQKEIMQDSSDDRTADLRYKQEQQQKKKNSEMNVDIVRTVTFLGLTDAESKSSLDFVRMKRFILTKQESLNPVCKFVEYFYQQGNKVYGLKKSKAEKKI